MSEGFDFILTQENETNIYIAFYLQSFGGQSAVPSRKQF